MIQRRAGQDEPVLIDWARARIGARGGILMRFMDPRRAGRIAEDEVRQQRWGIHADEIETSMIFYMITQATVADILRDIDALAAAALPAGSAGAAPD